MAWSISVTYDKKQFRKGIHVLQQRYETLKIKGGDLSQLGVFSCTANRVDLFQSDKTAPLFMEPEFLSLAYLIRKSSIVLNRNILIGNEHR